MRKTVCLFVMAVDAAPALSAGLVCKRNAPAAIEDEPPISRCLSTIVGLIAAALIEKQIDDGNVFRRILIDSLDSERAPGSGLIVFSVLAVINAPEIEPAF